MDISILKEIKPSAFDEMSAGSASVLMRKIRWPKTNGEPICPKCGHDGYYDLKSRPVFKCRSCHKQYSETSGTIFGSRKRNTQSMLKLVACLTQGMSARQAAQECGTDYHTAHDTSVKLRMMGDSNEF